MAPRKNTKLDAIYDVFEKHGVDVGRDDIWEVQGTPVVKHKLCEVLGAKIGVEWDVPTIIRAERDEAVIMVSGSVGDRTEWSIGEALVNGNYRVSAKQPAYVYAMAEKRAKDRVILKLANLHGQVYSEEEADDFKDKRSTTGRSVEKRPANDNPNAMSDDEIDSFFDLLSNKLSDCKQIKEVTAVMDDEKIKSVMSKLSNDDYRDARKLGADRLKALGWGKRQQQEAA